MEPMRALAGGDGNQSWEHFPHGADIGVRGFGATVAQAFEQAAVSMTAVITDPAAVAPAREVAISCSARSPDLLLVDWLNALVFEMATRRMLFSRFAVRIEGERLHGQAWGESIDVARHQPAAEVKGATYTMLSVQRGADGRWVAECVLDV